MKYISVIYIYAIVFGDWRRSNA